MKNFHSIKVLTYNILAQHLVNKLEGNVPDDKFLQWNFRLNNIINLVKQKDVDIICFQEIDNTKDIYFKDLKKKMEELGYEGKKTTDNDKTKKKLECAIFFKKYINFINKVKHKSRTCNIKLNIKGIDIRIVSLHCDGGTGKSWNEKLPLRDTHINKLIKDKLYDDTNVIICGDFNESPKTILDRGDKRLLNNPKYKFQKVIFPPHATVINRNYLTFNCPSSQVDHIFYRGNIELVNINEMTKEELNGISKGIPNEKYGSDHLPLICEFLLSKEF